MAGVTGVRAAIPIVALDYNGFDAAIGMAREIKDLCSFFKVGSELFAAAGPPVVHALRHAGCEVFLDLKFHDIPNTVRRSASIAAGLGVRLITVHATGGTAMIRAAVDGAAAECAVLAVTVLTSFDRATLGQAWGRVDVDIEAEVVRLAGLARQAGALGVVCSGQEAAAVRAAYGDDLKILVPGVRLAAGPRHDQVRVVTPQDAVRAGASYVVLGRAVTAAADPRSAMREVLADLAR